jgi:hypothetical protein
VSKRLHRLANFAIVFLACRALELVLRQSLVQDERALAEQGHRVRVA